MCTWKYEKEVEDNMKINLKKVVFRWRSMELAQYHGHQMFNIQVLISFALCLNHCSICNIHWWWISLILH